MVSVKPGYENAGGRLLSRIRALALTHKDVSRDLLGVLERNADQVLDRFSWIAEGIVVVATCNRFEAYMDRPNTVGLRGLLEWLEGIGVRGGIRILEGVDAVRHLFRVSSGLESAVIGDHEVLGQVRDSWLKAKERGLTTPLLDEVFHWSIKVGARVRSETGISRGPAGYPQAAVVLAERVTGSLEGAYVGIVGAGMAAKIIAESLCDKRRPRSLVVFNRTVEKGLEVLSKCRGVEGEARSLGELKSMVNGFDVLFIAVGGGVKLLEPETLRGEKPRVVVDISVPSTVDRVPGRVYVSTDVEKVANEALHERMKWIPLAEEIIEESIKEFLESASKRPAREAARAVLRLASILLERELKELERNLERGADPLEAARAALNSYTKKIARPLTRALYRLAEEGRYEAIEAFERSFVEEYSRRNGK